MAKQDYSDHGLVGSVDDTFAFGPVQIADDSKTIPTHIKTPASLATRIAAGARAMPAQAMTLALGPKQIAEPKSIPAQVLPPLRAQTQIDAETRAISAKVIPTAEIAPYQITTDVLLQSPRPPETLKSLPQRKELKTAAELASMIERELARHPECPRNGFRVTVYGATDWRAMLTITPAAGRIREPQHWRDLTAQLADRLRQLYNLAWE
jgi:hypothetical protein